MTRLPPPFRHNARRARQRGLSVVELMVGLTVGMLLVAGLALMFGYAKRSSVELEKSVRHIENGRQAIDLLSEDLALAGFYGTIPATTYAADTTLTPCADGATVATALSAMAALPTPTVPFPVEGLFPSQTTYGGVALSCLANRKGGTPALILRRLDTATTAVGSTAANVAYVQTSHSAADNFYSYRASANGSNFTLRTGTGAINPVRRFVTRAYYIATCSDCSGAGDGIPTLTRVEVVGTQLVVSPLAEGIDQVGFDYGFDTNNDGAADEWYGLNDLAGQTEANTAAASPRGWGNVVAVRVLLVSRNTERTVGHTDTRTYAIGRQGTTDRYTSAANDNFKRRSYVTTVRLQTVAGLREKP